jgi:hypothetical protein
MPVYLASCSDGTTLLLRSSSKESARQWIAESHGIDSLPVRLRPVAGDELLLLANRGLSAKRAKPRITLET